jgi:molybdopterin-containing oxidoreductase family membrane subunit
MSINLFMVLVELFTASYSGMPHHAHAFEYLFFGLAGKSALVPWMRLNVILTVCSVVLLLIPAVRKDEGYLASICTMVIFAIWIEKGMGMVVTGFIPSPLGQVTEYAPTLPEITVTLGVYAIGLFVLTVLYKIVIGVRERIEVA